MYYNNVKKKKSFKILLIILVVFLVVFTGYSLKYNRQSTIIESIIKDSVSYVINIVSTPFKFVSEKWNIFMQADEIYKDYEKLKKESKLSISKETKIKELENENEKLRKQLGIQNSILGYEEINATVIHRTADYWLDTVVIDKGRKAGIDTDMAVIIHGGLIGYVSNVSDYTSTVTLLTNPHMVNKISVRIEVSEGKYAYGLLSSYDIDNNLYQIEGISEYHEIPVNAIVTTTGLTERFPGGILIGTVKSINTDNYDLTKVVMATPIIELDDITYVTVLKREALSE